MVSYFSTVLLFCHDYFYYQYAYILYLWQENKYAGINRKTLDPQRLYSVKSALVHLESSAMEVEIPETSLSHCSSDLLSE